MCDAVLKDLCMPVDLCYGEHAFVFVLAVHHQAGDPSCLFFFTSSYSSHPAAIRSVLHVYTMVS